jgi:hypothetical protein
VVHLQGEGSVWSFRRDGSELAVITVLSRLRVTAAEGVRAAVLVDVGPTIASERMFSPELRIGQRPCCPVGMESPGARPIGRCVRPGAPRRPRHARLWSSSNLRSTHDVRPPGVNASAAAGETNQHLFDAGRHSTHSADEYGDTRSCSFRASFQGVSPCPAFRS